MRVVGVVAIVVALIFIIAPDSRAGRGISSGFRHAHEFTVAAGRMAGWDIR